MDSIKNILLKIIAFICCTHDDKVVDKHNTPSSTAQEEQIFSDENKPHGKTSRMFNGALSSKVQGQLFLGIEAANHMVMQEAINHGANVNTTINGLDPLEYAIKNGKDHIIEFLLVHGAEIKAHHIELARSYQKLYETNLNDPDMVFHDTQSTKQKTIEEEIRQYHMIADYLQTEMLYREQEKKAQEEADLRAKNIQKHSTARTTSSAAAAAAAAPTAVDARPSSRPRIVTFANPAAGAAARSSDDK